MKVKAQRLQFPSLLLGIEIKEKEVEFSLLFYKVSVSWGKAFSWENTGRPVNIVVAGSYHEYLKWVIKTNKNPKDYRFVSEPIHIVGYGNTPINVYYVGRYDQNRVHKSATLELRNITREVYENV